MDRYRGRSPPPRDRPPVRPRDDHPDVEYFGQGESYRPGGSTGEGPYRPPHRERVLDTWNNDRRDERRREDVDSYIPNQRPRSRSPSSFRRRSRSPYGRNKELFPDRPRSPSRRHSPRRDDRDRSQIRKRSRSPGFARTRSPEPRRTREHSPDSRRSPKRERLSSPHGRYDRPKSPPRRPYSPAMDVDRNVYRPRSRSPPRAGNMGGNRPTYADDGWRRRSPSPRASGPASNSTSRRSSPRAYPDRNSLAGSAPRSPLPQTRYDSKTDSSGFRPRSPSGFGDRSANPTPPPVSRDLNAPPTGPASQRNTYDRPPPTGPARSYAATLGGPPTGPASHNLSSMHNRGVGATNPPSQPRAAAPTRFSPLQRDFSTSPLRGRGSLTYRAPGVRPSPYQESGPPSGPRAGTFGASRGDFAASRGTYNGYGRGDSSYSASFRPPSNSSSATYPRTQRFGTTSTHPVQNHLSSLEKIVPGGKKLPSGLSPDVEKRLHSLSADAEKLRSIIEEKQKSKREAINEWEVRERESAREALRSELAEEALAKLMDGEENSGGAAF